MRRTLAIAVIGALGYAPSSASPQELQRICPCGPATMVSRYETTNQLKEAAEQTGPSFIVRAQQAAAESRRKGDTTYRVVDGSLFVNELVTGWIPVLGQGVEKLHNEMRDQIKDQNRKVAIRLVSEQLQRTPSISSLNQAAKRDLIREALAASTSDPSYTISDAYQNKAIEVLTAAIDDLNTRTALLQEASTQAAPAATLADLVSAGNQLASIKNKLETKAKELAATTSLQPDPTAALRQQLNRASSFAAEASEQFGAAAGIAGRLGSPSLAKSFAKGSQIVGVASLALRAYAGDPTAYLPAINAVLSLGGGGDGGDAAIAAALAKISQQITELTNIVEANHKATMARLDYIAFLGETTLEGITYLLAQGLNSCTKLIPDTWWTQADGKPQHLTYTKPLVFGSYRELRGQFAANDWGPCRNALSNQLAKGQIGASFRLDLSPASPAPGQIQQVVATYRAAQRVYPAEGTVDYLMAPPRWVEDLTDPSFLSYATSARAQAGSNYWDPRDVETHLLDPYFTEVIGGYVLALHGLFDVTDGKDLLPFGRPSPDTYADRSVPLEMLQSALGHVNLAIAQQQMLYGIVLKERAELEAAEIATYLATAKFAPYQIGTIVTGSIVSDRIGRQVYTSAAKAQDLVWVRQVVDGKSAPLGGLENIRIEDRDGQKRLIGDIKLGKDKAPVPLILPGDTSLADVAPMAHPDNVVRLAQLQSRLIQAIDAYTKPTNASPELQQYQEGALLASAGWRTDQ